MTHAPVEALPLMRDTAWLPRPVRDLFVVALLASVLLPLVSGLAVVTQPAGRAAMSFWWRDGRGWRLLVWSLGFATTGASVGLLAGWAVALAAPRSAVAQRLVLGIVCLPLLVPSSLVGVGWIMAMGRDAVLTNALRPLLGGWTPTIYDWPVAAATTGLRYAGVAALVVTVSRQGSEGARAAEQVFGLTLPARLASRAAATLVPACAAWLLLVLLVQSDHILPGMFLVHTFGTEVLIQFNALMDPAGAVALAIPPALIALATCAAAARLLQRRTWTVVTGSALTISDRPMLVAVKAATILLALGTVVAVPVAGIIVRTGHWRNCVDAWTDARPEMLHSVGLALAGSMATVLLAAPLAAVWVRQDEGGRTLFMPLVLLNLAVPGSLLALGTLLFPQPHMIRDSNAPLIFTYAARFVGVASIVLFAGWVRQSPIPDLAARLHGVPTPRRWLYVSLPRYAPAGVAALCLVGLLILAELEISLLLVRPGPTTLGVRLYTLIHTAPDHMVAALAVDVMLTTIAVIVAGSALAYLPSCLLRRRA